MYRFPCSLAINLKQRIYIIVFSLLFHAGSVFFSADSKQSIKASRPTYVIEQNNQVVGKTRITVAAHSIRVDLDNSKSAAMKTPYLQATLFSEKQKTYFRTPTADLRGLDSKRIVASFGESLNPKIWKQESKKTDGAFTYVLFSARMAPPPKSNRTNAEASRDYSGIRSARYKLLIVDGVPIAANNAICRFVGLPALGGIPMQMEYVDESGANLMMLTSSIRTISQSALISRAGSKAHMEFPDLTKFKDVGTEENFCRPDNSVLREFF